MTNTFPSTKCITYMSTMQCGTKTMGRLQSVEYYMLEFLFVSYMCILWLFNIGESVFFVCGGVLFVCLVCCVFFSTESILFK